MLGRNPAGFFLLVETEETDTRAHRNAAFDVLAAEMRAFDEALRQGLAFQQRNPGTLVLVLGDHDTGGLGIEEDSTHTVPVASYVNRDHTANMVPAFAQGPGADAFAGILSNAQVGRLLLEMVRR